MHPYLMHDPTPPAVGHLIKATYMLWIEWPDLIAIAIEFPTDLGGIEQHIRQDDVDQIKLQQCSCAVTKLLRSQLLQLANGNMYCGKI